MIHIYKYYKYITNHDTFFKFKCARILPLIFFFSPYLNNLNQLKPVFVNFGEFVTMMSSKVLSFPARSWVFGANNMSTKSFKLLPGLNQAIEYQSHAVTGSAKLRVQQARTFSCSSGRLVSQMPTTRPSRSNTRHFKMHSSPLIIPKQAGSGVISNLVQKSSFSSSAFAASASNSGPSVFYRLSRGISFLFYTAVVVGGIGIFVSNLFGERK